MTKEKLLHILKERNACEEQMKYIGSLYFSNPDMTFEEFVEHAYLYYLDNEMWRCMNIRFIKYKMSDIDEVVNILEKYLNFDTEYTGTCTNDCSECNLDSLRVNTVNLDKFNIPEE